MEPSSTSSSESDIKLWLTSALSGKNYKNLSINSWNIKKKSEIYCGEVIEVNATGITENGTEQCSFILKCGNLKSPKKIPLEDFFHNETYIYEDVLPFFKKFQNHKSIASLFEAVPKCFGTLSSNNNEVIVLENLSLQGYEVCDVKTPFSRAYLDLVAQELGKFHSISIAIKAQEPGMFREMSKHLRNNFRKNSQFSNNLICLLEKCANETYNLLKNELDSAILARWRIFKGQSEFIATIMMETADCLRVITHGDCWNSNYMFKSANNFPIKVAFLDWQLSRVASPILDLSMFIFTCISEEDLENLDFILKTYHDSLFNHLRLLGNDPDLLYPWNQFLEDWKMYSRFGVAMANLCIRSAWFESIEDSDLEGFKKRIKYVVKFAFQHDLI